MYHYIAISADSNFFDGLAICLFHTHYLSSGLLVSPPDPAAQAGSGGETNVP